jgi:hypothetical protein
MSRQLGGLSLFHPPEVTEAPRRSAGSVTVEKNTYGH